MAREADDVWVSDIFHNRIRKVKENGNQITSFSNPDQNVRDLAWDGNHIWAINTGGTLRKYTTQGVPSGAISGLLQGGWGLTFENGYLWASDPDTGRIYQIALDSTPPDAPIDLEANPAGWTRTNAFSIDWVNPSDTSGIAGAYYKLGTPPTSVNDGIYTTAKPFTVAARSQGGEQLFLWLKDNMNNADHNASSVDTLFYDATGPHSGTITINNGDSLTLLRTVTLSNISAVDSFSGMGDGAQMQFSNDGSLWSPAVDYDSVMTEWDLGGFGGSDTPGGKRVSVKFRDVAGNWSVSFYDDITYAPPLTIKTTALPDGSIGIPYQSALIAHGGSVPYAWSLSSGSLPDGLDLGSDGIIEGMPEATGFFDFSVAVLDSTEETVVADLSITIGEAAKADVDGNGQFNILDVLLVVNNILGIVEFSPGQEWAADMNEDGVINILDAVELVKIILGVGRDGLGSTPH